MERHFDEELKELNLDLMKMGTMVEEAIIKSVQALRTRGENLAREVIADDRKIDEQELVIEERCLTLLAIRQPMAVDLRFVTTAMNINAELERIADLAVDIAQRVLEIADKPLLKPLVDIPKLCSIAQLMVQESLEAFIKHDVELARQVVVSDKIADEYRNIIQKELIYDYMVKDGAAAPLAVPLLLIARHLERICDHTTNIAEDVIYMVNAKVVKHHPENLSD